MIPESARPESIRPPSVSVTPPSVRVSESHATQVSAHIKQRPRAHVFVMDA